MGCPKLNEGLGHTRRLLLLCTRMFRTTSTACLLSGPMSGADNHRRPPSLHNTLNQQTRLVLLPDFDSPAQFSRVQRPPLAQPQAFSELFWYINAVSGIGWGHALPMMRPGQGPPHHLQEPCQNLAVAQIQGQIDELGMRIPLNGAANAR